METSKRTPTTSSSPREPLTYAERLHRLTMQKLAERAQAMAAEFAAEEAARQAKAKGRNTGGSASSPEGPPARSRKAPTRRRKG